MRFATRLCRRINSVLALVQRTKKLSKKIQAKKKKNRHHANPIISATLFRRNPTKRVRPWVRKTDGEGGQGRRDSAGGGCGRQTGGGGSPVLLFLVFGCVGARTGPPSAPGCCFRGRLAGGSALAPFFCGANRRWLPRPQSPSRGGGLNCFAFFLRAGEKNMLSISPAVLGAHRPRLAAWPAAGATRVIRASQL